MSAAATIQRNHQPIGVEVPIDEIEVVSAPAPAESEPELRDVERAGLLALVEMILKSPRRLDRLIRRADLQPALIPRFLAISLLSFALFGVALAIVFDAAEVAPRLTAIDEHLRHKGTGEPLIRFEPAGSFAAQWTSGAALQFIAAYCFGLIAATGVCLPSLYFYGLLSGIRLSMLDVVTHALKSKATSAIALMGILPIYVAVCMGVFIFDVFPRSFLHAALWLGFMLPFLAGLWGTASLYRGFATLTDTLPPDRCERRGCFLRRLVVSWAACYTAVSPVMIYTVWQALQEVYG
jgi:hypothetical protein